ncbi:MAG TPA: hypothetical protein VEA15_05050 [Caulobacteraceae bacterium]|nr:hypothetical protein [Caulobacteraceae bacterium]
MAYREKLAWLTLLAMALTFGPYFVWIGINPPEPGLPNLRAMATYAVVGTSYAVLTGLIRLGLRLHAPADAKARPDERDVAIEGRATKAGYYLLMAGMIAVGGFMPFTHTGWDIVNAAIGAIVAAEILSTLVTVIGYRRTAA